MTLKDLLEKLKRETIRVKDTLELKLIKKGEQNGKPNEKIYKY